MPTLKPLKPVDQIKNRFSADSIGDGAAHESPPMDIGGLDAPVPPELVRTIRQRTESAQAFAADVLPEAGLIVAFPGSVNVSAGGEPLPAILNLYDAENGLWNGWVVSRDSDYASCWDLILGPEEQNLDPICEIVQAWNPVKVRLHPPLRALGKLAKDRLAALRMLAEDCTTQTILEPIRDTRPRVQLARLLSDGTGVVTGTPLGGAEDPRHQYQKLYRSFAQELSGRFLPKAGKPAPKASGSGFLAWLASYLRTPQRLAAVAGLLLVVPLVAILVLNQQTSQQPEHISGGTTQQLKVTDVDAYARELEQQLTSIGLRPEVTHLDTGRIVSLTVDLSVADEKQASPVLQRFGLKFPAGDHMLRVLVLKQE